MTITWCMVSEIRSATDRIFCHFRHFWHVKCDGRHCYFSFWAILCHLPFALLQSPSEKSNFKIKWKKPWRYHYFTQVYQNHDHMPYCSWDMVYDGCNCYFSFWANFCPFNALKSINRPSLFRPYPFSPYPFLFKDCLSQILKFYFVPNSASI